MAYKTRTEPRYTMFLRGLGSQVHKEFSLWQNRAYRSLGTIRTDKVGPENAASTSVVIDPIRVQLRPKSGVLATNFRKESQ
jgi:hypothetical protein